MHNNPITVFIIIASGLFTIRICGPLHYPLCAFAVPVGSTRTYECQVLVGTGTQLNVVWISAGLRSYIVKGFGVGTFGWVA